MTDKPTKKRSRKAGHQAPEGYDASAYPTFSVTVDVVIMSVVDGQLMVLLVQRQADPYKDAWALPGGFKQPDESLDAAAFRELREETGVDAPKHLAQFATYGDPARDPRGNVVTVVYLAVTPEVGSIEAGTDADDARLWPVSSVLDGDVALAFDHERILSDAVERAADQLEGSDLATAFVGPTFTLSELQSVYEAIWDDQLDTGNFRRSLSMGSPDASYVVSTGERAAAGPKGGRPPELFEVGDAWIDGSPVKRAKRRTTKQSEQRMNSGNE
ncbi:MAG: NUDIX domain-containing protein [Actinomycetota bacterium]|nr:NUDIX domain-containing protein [Actinomycetota bacterium]